MLPLGFCELFYLEVPQIRRLLLSLRQATSGRADRPKNEGADRKSGSAAPPPPPLPRQFRPAWEWDDEKQEARGEGGADFRARLENAVRRRLPQRVGLRREEVEGFLE